MAEMARTNADIQPPAPAPARRPLDHRSAIREWHGDGATVFTFGGADERIAADSLVLACTNIPIHAAPRRWPMRRLPSAVGDAVAARTAVMAIYEGRKLGMAV